jgi:SagB-type dehydrogenase family enzyme
VRDRTPAGKPTSPSTEHRSWQYRRSRFLICNWEGADLVLRNYRTDSRVAASPSVLDILSCFDDWTTAEAVRHRYPQLPARLWRRAVTSLARHGFLDVSRGALGALDVAEPWECWAPDAALFHFGTRDVAFAPREIAGQLLRDRASHHPPPRPLKPPAPRASVALPPPVDPPQVLSDVLRARRSWRRFGPDAVTAAQLSTLLHLTWGVQHWVRVNEYEEVALKTSPSGGARHSIEAYVLVLNVTGVARGLYHYEPDAHGLGLVRRGATRRQVQAYLPSQPWFAGASAVVFMTTVFERVAWRYPHPRAYRVVLAESGHLCQTFLLMATSLGLAPFCTMALADSRLERDLGIDGAGESVLYAAGVGTRPPDVEWAPRPEGSPTPRRRPASVLRR